MYILFIKEFKASKKIDIKILGKMMTKKGYKEKKLKRTIGTQRKTIRFWENLIWDEEAVCVIEDED